MKVKKIKLFCLDDHRSFSDEIRKKFADDHRFQIYSTNNKEEYIKTLSLQQSKLSVIVPIAAIHNNREQIESLNQVFRDPRLEKFFQSVILLVPPEKYEELCLETTIPAYSFIPRNTNFMLRLNNTIKKMVSEHNLITQKYARNVFLWILISVTALILFFLGIHF